MKVSLNTIRSFNKRYECVEDVTAIGTKQLVEKIGSQLGAVEEIVKFGKKYEGIVIAKVVACEPHPNADKLQVCKVDDGGRVKNVERDENGLVQVVCGAPNVRPNLQVAWLPPGVTIPETADKEPFILEARDFRGQVSNGMLASLRELALGDSHEGILEVDGEYAPGTDFATAYELSGDIVLDIENKMFTHRPDCFGFLGVARELAGIQGMLYTSPEWYREEPTFPSPEGTPLPLIIQNELPELVPRFTAITMSEVTIGPSPLWLQIELAKVGQKSINNIVDYTNWLMLETGQPLHAYDYDKVRAASGSNGPTIVIRHPKSGETIQLLNGKEVEPRSEAIMIATDKKVIGIGGVMGGSETEVDEQTTNIIIECANFDMYSIRRTSMAQGLFTDAVTRFTKGQSPLQNLAVLHKIVEEIEQHANGKVAGEVLDDNNLGESVMLRRSLHEPVIVSVDFINSRLGLQLSAAEMKTLLTNVEFEVNSDHDELNVKAPFWRTDIEQPEDVVEEIGRLYGYDKLTLTLPRRSIEPTTKDELLTLKANIRRRLAASGANEILTYSFVHGDLLSKVGQDPAKAFQVANALSPDLQYYRLSLLPSLLEKVHPNMKAGYEEFALFEIGKTHGLDQGEDEEGLPREFEFTALIIAANDKQKKPGAAYYQAKIYLEALVGPGNLTFQSINESMQAYQVTKPYALERSAAIYETDGVFVGIIGELRPSVSRALKLPKYCAGFEVDTKVLGSYMSRASAYTPLSRFPSVKQDITLALATELAYDKIYDFVQQACSQNAPKDTHTKLEPIDIYQKPDQPDRKHVTFRLTTTSMDRTLTDKEINKLLDAVAVAAKTELRAERI